MGPTRFKVDTTFPLVKVMLSTVGFKISATAARTIAGVETRPRFRRWTYIQLRVWPPSTVMTAPVI